ncbi:MAG: hypothetical protein ACOY46_19700 [Bacillota bacterium]
MSQITVTINAPELVSALRTLAEALNGKGIPAMTPAPAAPVQQPMQQPVTPAPAAPMAPANVQQPVQQPTMPAAPAAPMQQPMMPAAAPLAPAPVPTTAPTYTMEQLAVAATQLVDAGRRNDVVTLLGQFGAQSVMTLPKEQYGNFATALRQMGVQI